MRNKSLASKRRPRSSGTYQKKLGHLKKWHSERVEARKAWSKEKLEKTKPLKPLAWYVEQLRPAGGKEGAKKTSSSKIAREDRTWW